MKSGTQYASIQKPAILLVGEQKSGKTRVALSFPAPYVLDVDMNLSSAARIMTSDTPFWYDQPSMGPDGKALSEELRWDAAIACLKAAALVPDVQTIVIDGLAGLSDYLIAHIIALAKKTEGKTIDRLRIQDYAPLKSLMTRLVMGLRTTNKIIVFTSHQKADKDELTGALRYTLNMPGSLSENFGGFFSDVWACTSTPAGRDKTKYEIRTKPTGFHVNLGTSYDLASAIDVTDKKPGEIWGMLKDKLILT